MANNITDPKFLADLCDAAVDQNIIFTGSREFPLHHQQVKIDQIIGRLGNAYSFITCACIGIDHYVALKLVQAYPNKEHVVVVPADRSRVARWWEPYPQVAVVEMPPGTSYKDRNQRAVDLGTFLIGFPARAEFDTASRRSGSWQAIRMARREYLHRPVVMPLAGM